MFYTIGIIICLSLFIFSLCMLKKEKILMYIKSFKWRIKPFKSRNKKVKNKGNEAKLKVAETQIRPILLPPSESKPLLKSSENQKQLNPPQQKNNVENNSDEINFGGQSSALNKLNDSKKAVNINEKNNSLSSSNQLNTFNISSNNTSPNFNISSNDTSSNFNNVKQNSFANNKFSTSANRYKTREDIDKEFEEVKKFLDIPSFDNIPQNKVPSQSNNKIEKKENEFNNTNNNSFEFYPKTNKLKQEFSQFNNENKQKNIVKVDDEEIDLNKLPSNLKKLIITSILSRKNYD